MELLRTATPPFNFQGFNKNENSLSLVTTEAVSCAEVKRIGESNVKLLELVDTSLKQAIVSHLYLNKAPFFRYIFTIPKEPIKRNQLNVT